MANKFTWFPKLTNALERVPEGPRAQLLWAIVQYGTNGVEPEFEDWALSAVFESLREDIDNSVEARAKNKGGRPRKAKPDEEHEARKENGGFEVSETDKTGVSESENGGFEVSETQETPPYIPNHTSPNQDIDSPIQGMADAMRAAPEGFEPPTLEECRAHFGANCLSGDPDAFWAYFESQGWVKGNGQPVSNWGALALDWSRRQKRIDADDRARGRPTSADVERAKFKPVARKTPEQELAEVEEEARRLGIAI